MNRWTSPRPWPTVSTVKRAGDVRTPTSGTGVCGLLTSPRHPPRPAPARSSTVGRRRSGTDGSVAGAEDRSATHTRPRGWRRPGRRERSGQVDSGGPAGSTTRVCAQSFATSAEVPRAGRPGPPTGSTSALAPPSSVIRTRNAAAERPGRRSCAARGDDRQVERVGEQQPTGLAGSRSRPSRRRSGPAPLAVVVQSGAVRGHGRPPAQEETRRSSYVPAQNRVAAPSARVERRRRRREAQDRPPPTAWLASGRRRARRPEPREPSKSGSRSSLGREQVDRARDVRRADRPLLGGGEPRPGVAVPQGPRASPDQSSLAGAPRPPGVHSVLK